MAFYEDIHAKTEDDPHGFRAKGANSPIHLHTNHPYSYQEFPKILVKTIAAADDAFARTVTLSVANVEQERKAVEEGWSEAPRAAKQPSADETIAAADETNLPQADGE